MSATLEQVRHYREMAEEAGHGSPVDAARRLGWLDEAKNRGYVVTGEEVVKDVWGEAR